MAQLKPCPPELIERAKREAEQFGQQYLVMFDSLMFEHKVISAQTYRGCYANDRRYEIVASTK